MFKVNTTFFPSTTLPRNYQLAAFYLNPGVSQTPERRFIARKFEHFVRDFRAPVFSDVLLCSLVNKVSLSSLPRIAVCVNGHALRENLTPVFLSVLLDRTRYFTMILCDANF